MADLNEKSHLSFFTVTINVTAPRNALGALAMAMHRIALKLGLEVSAVPSFGNAVQFGELPVEARDALMADMLADDGSIIELNLPIAPPREGDTPDEEED